MQYEHIFYRNRVKPILDMIAGMTYERVELKTGKSGMPDIIYDCGGTGFIENKWSDSTDRIDLSRWKKPQRKFARKYRRVFLLVGSKEWTILINPTRVGDYERNIPLNHPAVLEKWVGKMNPVTLKWHLYWKDCELPSTAALNAACIKVAEDRTAVSTTSADER